MSDTLGALILLIGIWIAWSLVISAYGGAAGKDAVCLDWCAPRIGDYRGGECLCAGPHGWEPARTQSDTTPHYIQD